MKFNAQLRCNALYPPAALTFKLAIRAPLAVLFLAKVSNPHETSSDGNVGSKARCVSNLQRV